MHPNLAELLVPQCHHGIDFSGAARRPQRRRQGHGQQQYRHRAERHWIGGRHLEQQAAQHARRGHGGSQPSGDSQTRRAAALRAAPGATRRPSARPSATRMPISCVRWLTEYDTTPYTPMVASSTAIPRTPAAAPVEIWGAPRNRRRLVHGFDVRNRLVRIDAVNGRLDRARHLARIVAGPYHQVREVHGRLRIGQEDGRMRGSPQFGLPGIRHHSYDSDRVGNRPADIQLLADGILPAKNARQMRG